MTCAKKIVTCKIITKDGLIFHGENSCNNPQTFCPRLPGEDYLKCKTICQQEGHAEIMAIKAAKDTSLKDAIAEIRGINYVCKECAKDLERVGIIKFTVFME